LKKAKKRIEFKAYIHTLVKNKVEKMDPTKKLKKNEENE